MKKKQTQAGRVISGTAKTKGSTFHRSPPARKVSLDHDLLHKMGAGWRAADHLSVGQTYHHDNSLLKKPLKQEHPCRVAEAQVTHRRAR